MQASSFIPKLPPVNSQQAFQQLNDDITKLVAKSGLLGNAIIQSAFKQLAQLPQQIAGIYTATKTKEGLVALCGVLRGLRSNNQFAVIYRQVMQSESCDLATVPAMLERIAKVWNEYLIDACLVGLRESDFAKSDELWWQLFQEVQDQDLAIAIFHEFVYRRPLKQRGLNRLFGGPSYAPIPAEEIMYPPESRDNLMAAVLKSCRLQDVNEDLIAVLQMFELLENRYMDRLQALCEQISAGESLTECVRRLGTVVNDMITPQSLLVNIMREHVIGAGYHECLSKNECSKTRFARQSFVDLLRYFKKVSDDYYYDTAAFQLIPSLALRLKTPADLRQLVVSVNDPRLAACLMNAHLSRVTNDISYKDHLSAEFDQAAEELVQLARHLQTKRFDLVDALNYSSDLLKRLTSSARQGLSLNKSLTEVRCANILLILYVNLLSQDNADWSQAAIWLQRIHRIWNDCVTEAVLTGYRESYHAQSDSAWWDLFSKVDDQLLAIAILKEFIYHREPQQSDGCDKYEARRTPIDVNHLPKVLGPERLVDVPSVALSTSRGCMMNDMEAIEYSNEMNRVAFINQSKVKAGVEFAVSHGHCCRLVAVLTAIEMTENVLFASFKQKCLEMKKAYADTMAATSEFKFQLSDMQAPRALQLYAERAIACYLQPVVEELYDRLPASVKLGEFVAEMIHPSLLICFLDKFLNRRNEQVANQRAGLFAVPAAQALPESNDSTFSSCRKSHAQPK